MALSPRITESVVAGYSFLSNTLGHLAFVAALIASVMMGPVLTPLALASLFGCSLLVGIIARKDEGVSDTLFATTSSWMMVFAASIAIPSALFSLMSNALIPLELGVSILGALPMILAATPAALFVVGFLMSLQNPDALSDLHRGITSLAIKLFTIPFGLVGAVIGGVFGLMAMTVDFIFRVPGVEPEEAPELPNDEPFVPTRAKVCRDLNIKSNPGYSAKFDAIPDNKNEMEPVNTVFQPTYQPAYLPTVNRRR
ncbi:MAG: hypothetical protein P4M14_00175 [Gammaproteobacteria bacterium]|nr:hypothetical protein [Gammaproteobacteria bacterium]